MSEIKIYAEDADGNRVDITEGVQVLYDCVHASMDWGSGFLSVEDVAGILNVAQAAGFLVPEEAREQYAEYARQIAGYWPSPPPFNGRDILVAKIKAGRNERVNCAACGEIAIFEMQSEKWEHAEPNSDHEVRLWR